MNKRKEIIQIINSISGRYSAYEVFTDWIRCMAMSIQNTVSLVHNKTWQDREKLYMDTINKYAKEEQMRFGEMMGLLVSTLEDGPDDVLGKIYMEANMGSKSAGQFFTPYHLSVLTAKVGMHDQIEAYKNGTLKRITLNEPSCGGGAMIIAAAQVLKEAGVNYQQALDVVAQDLDWKGVYMCYVQLSLLGISAICVQGNTLTDPYDPEKTERSHMLITPKKAGALL